MLNLIKLFKCRLLLTRKFNSQLCQLNSHHILTQILIDTGLLKAQRIIKLGSVSSPVFQNSL